MKVDRFMFGTESGFLLNSEEKGDYKTCYYSQPAIKLEQSNMEYTAKCMYLFYLK